MVISYAEIGSDSGPFVFIRLLEPIDERKQDILGWAKHLSRVHFDNRPVVVALVDQKSQRILNVFPATFAPVVQNMSWAGIFLSPASVDDIPPHDFE